MIHFYNERRPCNDRKINIDLTYTSFTLGRDWCRFNVRLREDLELSNVEVLSARTSLNGVEDFIFSSKVDESSRWKYFRAIGEYILLQSRLKLKKQQNTIGTQIADF